LIERKPQFIHDGIRHATINGHRFHLRLADPGETNFLWIDGRSPPLALDQVAADFVGHMIDAMWEHQSGVGDESEKVKSQVISKIYKKYGTPLIFWKKRVNKARIEKDFNRIFGGIMAIAENNCPLETGVEINPVSQDSWAAPARMDLALTYRCNLDCSHCYTGGPREMVELPTSKWVSVLETLWRIGVPQVVFTGGEPTLRDDLLELISEADEFVTGLVTNGTYLEEMAAPLKEASLDYVQVTLESYDPRIHNNMVGDSDATALPRTVSGVKKALDIGLDVVTNTTLTSKNAKGFKNLIRFGKDLGLSSMACNTLICSGRGKSAKKTDGLPIEEMNDLLKGAVETAQDVGMNLQWYTPTCYNTLNPLELGFGPKSCSAAAYNMTVQPDGSVLPCQSWPDQVGHILDTPWSEIWNHSTCDKLRDRGFGKENEECTECADLPICGGGCPLEEISSNKDQG